MPYLWLCPASQENLDATIHTPVPFEKLDILRRLDDTIPQRCRRLYDPTANGFRCWALRRDPRAFGFFQNYMKTGSVCLFSVSGTGAFQVATQVVGKVQPCACNVANADCCDRRRSTRELAGELWPVNAGNDNPWELLFFTTQPYPIKIPKPQLVQAMGWSRNYGIPFTRPVIDVDNGEPRHEQLLRRINSFDRLWNDIVARNPVDYLYAG